ncbi:MAG: hypothetical protein ACFFDU_03600 [Candidatus Thorarchaeota archaeon]
MELQIPEEIQRGLEEKAREANISPEAAAILILSEYIRVFGSAIYVGTWRRGNQGGKKGMRYVVEWPFQPGLVKIPGDQSIDEGKRDSI